MLTHRELHKLAIECSEENPAVYGEPIPDYEKWLESRIPIPQLVTDKTKQPKVDMIVFLCCKNEWYTGWYDLKRQMFMTDDADKLDENEVYWIPCPYSDFTWYSDEEE
jgi:hypothetical protein